MSLQLGHVKVLGSGARLAPHETESVRRTYVRFASAFM